jgi:hypothetical protein
LSETLDFVEPKIVTSQYKDIAKYQDFVFNHADYARELEYIKHMTLDLDR